jgi:hypothetical protein
MHMRTDKPNAPPGSIPLSDAALDRISRTLVPHAPDEVRHILRAPLKRWHSGTVKFLHDPGNFTLREFACSWMLLASFYPIDAQRWVCAMTCTLYQLLDIAELELKLEPDVPDSEALRLLTTKLFSPNPADVFVPLYAETRH